MKTLALNFYQTTLLNIVVQLSPKFYDLQILDSMKTVELIVAIGREFGIEVSPAEFEREAWATPRKLVADILRRLAI